ncbi:MAG: hypothetical protein WCX90_05705 [Thiohalomonadaceae bacterium]
MYQLRSSLILACLLFSTTAMAQEQTRQLSLPPDSLAQWYPPANKRQVWLHTMFSLRRAMQAVGEYNALGDDKLTVQWAERFAKSYKQLAKMVPEWSDEIEETQADNLVTAAKQGDQNGVNSALHRLGTTCRSCHNENRAMVTLIYRIPDYRDVTVESSETLEEIPYPKHMERMGMLMNRIKIAQQDQRHKIAQESGNGFIAATKDLSTSCTTCHKEDKAPRERIFGAMAQQALSKLNDGLSQNDTQQTDEALGVLGAYTCGRCHSIHKNTAELRRALLPRE